MNTKTRREINKSLEAPLPKAIVDEQLERAFGKEGRERMRARHAARTTDQARIKPKRSGIKTLRDIVKDAGAIFLCSMLVLGPMGCTTPVPVEKRVEQLEKVAELEATEQITTEEADRLRAEIRNSGVARVDWDRVNELLGVGVGIAATTLLGIRITRGPSKKMPKGVGPVLIEVAKEFQREQAKKANASALDPMERNPSGPPA